MDPTTNDIKQRLLNAIAGPESAGRYDIRYDGGAGAKINDFSRHPGIFVQGPAGKTSAAGRYQFTKSTWDGVPKSIAPDFTPQSQDNAAWYVANRDYKANTGRDLTTDLQQRGFGPHIVAGLGSTWRGLADNPRKAAQWYNGGNNAVASAPHPKPATLPMMAALNGGMGNPPVVNPLGQLQPRYGETQPKAPPPPPMMAGMSGGNPMAYNGATPTPASISAGQNAIQQTFGAPGGAPQQAPLTQEAPASQTSSPTSSGVWDNLSKVGRGLTGAGAALMAINNPGGAAVLSHLANQQDDTEQNDWQNTVQNGQLIRINKKTGAVEASDIPGFKKDTSDDWTTTIHNGQVIRYNRKTGESSASAVPGYKDDNPTDNYDEATLKGVGQDYLINGNDRALAAFKEPTRIKALQLARDQFKQDSGRDWDSADSAIQRGAYKAYLANSAKYGQMLAPTQAAHDRLQADIQIAKERVADLPAELNANNLPMNKFMQMTAEQLQNAGYAKLAKAREALYNVERGYSSVQANGMRGGDTVASQKRAEALINSAMTPEVLLGEVGKDGKRSGGLLDFMGESSHRILQGVKGGQETLRNEFRRGIQNVSSPIDRLASSEDAEIDKRIGGGQQAAPQQSPQAPQPTPSQSAPTSIKTDDEYEKLPSGAIFVGPDGKKRRKP